MISNVFLSGRLGKKVDEHIREVEVDRVLPGPGGHYATDVFLVKNYLDSKTLFFQAKVGSLIVMKGRIENDPHFGMVLIDELDEILMPKNSELR